jgi:hypothetical protein
MRRSGAAGRWAIGATKHAFTQRVAAKEVTIEMPSHADDSELIAEFFRTERDSEQTRVLVRMISWRGPHTPTSTWVAGITLSGSPAASEVDEAVRTLLLDSRFFRTCRECCKSKPVGWMDDEHICQACATRNHGVVY